MENEVVRLLEESNHALRVADYMFYMTYPLVKDVKLLIKIMENLNIALEKGIEALLYYERLYKRISAYPDDFKAKFDILKFKIAEKYNINRENIVLLYDIHNFVEARKKSSMEFIRNNQVIVANNNYKMQTIDLRKTKDFLNQTKRFIGQINNILKVRL